MKMYLRQQPKGVYYTGKDGPAMWSDSKQEARMFLAFPEMDAHCAELRLSQMEIVADYGDDELVIPVQQRFPEIPPPK